MDAASVRSVFLVAAVPLVLPPGTNGEGLPVDTRRFPSLVRLLLLPEEDSLLRQLKDEKDRLEFQKLFWARRDPTPGTAANEFENGVRDSWKKADDFFSYPNQKGSESGCGQVLALLGEPEEVLGLETKVRFDDLQYLREGDRKPETWVYRDRPGRPFRFTQAELRVAFDSECRFAEGGNVAEDLRRAAAVRVTRKELALSRGPDGHLVPLATQVGGAAGAIDLLTAPRADFPLAAEVSLVLRGAKGEALVAGLARIASATASARVSLAARAEGEGGQQSASGLRDSAVAPLSDGSAVASWSLSLKPGRQKVTVAVQLQETGKGSVATVEVVVPDFAAGTLVASPLVLYPDEPASAAADPRDAYAAMRLGPRTLRTRFGNAFAPTDALTVVAALYGAKPDVATGRAALRSRYSILKDGKPVARGGEDAFATPDAVASVGPIPLASYAPGAYVVRLDATDGVTQQTLRQEAVFEIRATGAAR